MFGYGETRVQISALTDALKELKAELRVRDERYYELLIKNNELCTSGHSRMTLIEKASQKHSGDIDRIEERINHEMVTHDHLTSKLEAVFSVDCKNPQERDIARAAFGWLKEADRESIEEMIEHSKTIKQIKNSAIQTLAHRAVTTVIAAVMFYIVWGKHIIEGWK